MSYFIRRHVLLALTFMMLLLILCLFAFAPRPVAGLDHVEQSSSEREITLVHHLGEKYIISAVAIQDNYAYIAADPSLGRAAGIAVLDISNPKVPQKVGFLPLGEQADELFAAEGYVFAHVGGEHKIIDISLPTHPREVGQLRGQEIKAVEGNIAYVRDGGGILRIWDISDPAAALEVGHYVYGNRRIEVANQHAYLLQGSKIRIVNLSEPSAPVEVGFFEIEVEGGVNDMGIKDHYALIAWGAELPWCMMSHDCDEGGIKVIDISNPTHPFEVTDYKTYYNNPYGHFVEANIGSFWVVGDYVMISTHYYWNLAYYEHELHRIELVNISDPTNPLAAGILPDGYPNDAAAAGDDLYLAYNMDGMQILGRGTYGTGKNHTVNDVVAVDDLAFLVGDQHLLRVVGFTKPTLPIELATHLGHQRDIKIKDNLAYIISNNDFYIMDITDPTAPTRVGSSGDGGPDIAIGDGYAYLSGCCDGAVSMVDISDPTNPTRFGSFDVVTDTGGYNEPKLTSGLVVEENYLYATWHDCYEDYSNGEIICNFSRGGFSIVDLSNPITPTLVSVTRGSTGSAIYVKDKYAYIGEYQNLKIFDVSEPTKPTVVASYPLSVTAYELTIKNNHAYLATSAGITVLDISDPTSPEEIASYAMPTASRGISVSDGYIYSANGDWGLITLQLGYHLKGRVSHANGQPFSGVVISSTTELSATTNSQGRYALLEQAPGRYTLTPTHASFLFSPPTQRVTTPPNATANFTILSAPVSVTLTPADSTTLLISDTQGLLTDFEWPAESVSLTTTLRLTPTLAADEPSFDFAGHAFELMAYQNGQEMPDFTFNNPFTITLRYSEADVRLIPGENQNQLALWWQQDNSWQDATQSCDTPTTYQRDISNKQISVPICRTGRLALFGPTDPLFLPLLFH